ncbi:hypothetical protein BC830DRAFT_1147814 [Chytriomyces sp. MP71]|nr:hypothetical protein BC830DRAFT_1147814 [Chytriomyces sp. MP71]
MNQLFDTTPEAPPPLLPEDPEPLAAVAIYWISTGVAFCALVYTLVLICFNEVKERTFTSFLRAVGTPFNICLLCGTASMTLFNILSSVSIIAINGSLDLDHLSLNFFMTLSLAASQQSYIQYCWFRTEAMLDYMYPNLITILRRLIQASPLLYLMPPICLLSIYLLPEGSPGLSAALHAFEASQSITSVVTLTLDALFLFLFIRVIRDLRSDLGGKMDTRFGTVARHGCAAAIGVALGSVLLGASLSNQVQGIDVLVALSYLAYVGVLCVLVRMKTVIQRIHAVEGNVTAAAIVKAKAFLSDNSNEGVVGSNVSRASGSISTGHHSPVASNMNVAFRGTSMLTSDRFISGPGSRKFSNMSKNSNEISVSGVTGGAVDENSTEV